MSYSESQTCQSTNDNAPAVTTDPRFRAGRLLVTSGRAAEAVPLFAALIEASKDEGDSSTLTSALCGYEYGHAIFRAHERSGSNPDLNSEYSAKSTEQRKCGVETDINRKGAATSKKRQTFPNDFTVSSNVHCLPLELRTIPEDLAVALEQMESAFAVIEERRGGNCNNWFHRQASRVLCGIGDLFSFLRVHGNAADAYLRALELRSLSMVTVPETIVDLQERRLLVEAHVLLAETLLESPQGKDVVVYPFHPSSILDVEANEKGTDSADTKRNGVLKQSPTHGQSTILVAAKDRLNYARGYYEKGRDELQETVVAMGKKRSSGVDVGALKEDICHLATMLMAVGNALADAIEEERCYAESEQHMRKKSKTA